MTTTGFEGCIKGVQLNQIVPNLVEDSIRSKGVIEGCPDQVTLSLIIVLTSTSETISHFSNLECLGVNDE